MLLSYPLIIFDSKCLLCEASIQFILKRDKKDIFHFAPLQSNVWQDMATRYGINTLEPQSWLLIEENKAYQDSAAIFRLCELLGGKFRFFLIFRFLPFHLPQKIYVYIAKHRYQFFGKKEVCFLPNEKDKAKFYLL